MPFSPLKKPLAEATIALVTTAMPDNSFTRNARSLQICDAGDPPDSLYTGELFWDSDSTHTDDLASFFPIRMLGALAKEGRIGGLAKHYYCVPTNYSQRNTIENDAPAIVAQSLQDEVDVVMLVPL